MVTAGAGLYMSVFASQYTGAGVGMFVGAALLLLVKVTLYVNIFTAREFISLLYIQNEGFSAYSYTCMQNKYTYIFFHNSEMKDNASLM